MDPACSKADDYTDVDEMFIRLARASTDEERRRCRDRIISRCLPLADHIAYKFVGKGELYDDIAQVARLGLVKAVDRYDPAKGRFLALAVPTIMGDVRRYFRDNTWAVHVPRNLKETHLRMHRVTDALSQRLGRAPTASELPAELGVARKDVVDSVGAAHAYRPVSLDTPMPSWNPGADDPCFERIEDAITVGALLSRLSAQESAIVRMRFCECMTQSEIARRIGVSQVHVSRLLADILRRLRRALLAERAKVCSAG
ncbi:MAG TPA: sigma-70 family RNA polymerase sigma factor [Mycobacterium sp.]|nr:sigma-70 family RNA polymerase sigma factor [Mycobacterium sp.]